MISDPGKYELWTNSTAASFWVWTTEVCSMEDAVAKQAELLQHVKEWAGDRDDVVYAVRIHKPFPNCEKPDLREFDKQKGERTWSHDDDEPLSFDRYDICLFFFILFIVNLCIHPRVRL